MHHFVLKPNCVSSGKTNMNTSLSLSLSVWLRPNAALAYCAVHTLQCVLVHKQCASLQSRDLIMLNFIGGKERNEALSKAAVAPPLSRTSQSRVCLLQSAHQPEKQFYFCVYVYFFTYKNYYFMTIFSVCFIIVAIISPASIKRANHTSLY